MFTTRIKLLQVHLGPEEWGDLNDSAHNQFIYQSVPFEDGQKVRILEQKKNLTKESKNLARKYIQ